MTLNPGTSEVIRNRLVQLFQPRKIIIFGSYAKGTATANSDIDIAVVVDDESKTERESVVEGRLALREALRGKNLPFDLIVETSGDFDRYRLSRCSIQYEIDKHGVVLYER